MRYIMMQSRPGDINNSSIHGTACIDKSVENTSYSPSAPLPSSTSSNACSITINSLSDALLTSPSQLSCNTSHPSSNAHFTSAPQLRILQKSFDLRRLDIEEGSSRTLSLALVNSSGCAVNYELLIFKGTESDPLDQTNVIDANSKSNIRLIFKPTKAGDFNAIISLRCWYCNNESTGTDELNKEKPDNNSNSSSSNSNCNNISNNNKESCNSKVMDGDLKYFQVDQLVVKAFVRGRAPFRVFSYRSLEVHSGKHVDDEKECKNMALYQLIVPKTSTIEGDDSSNGSNSNNSNNATKVLVAKLVIANENKRSLAMALDYSNLIRDSRACHSYSISIKQSPNLNIDSSSCCPFALSDREIDDLSDRLAHCQLKLRCATRKNKYEKALKFQQALEDMTNRLANSARLIKGEERRMSHSKDADWPDDLSKTTQFVVPSQGTVEVAVHRIYDEHNIIHGDRLDESISSVASQSCSSSDTSIDSRQWLELFEYQSNDYFVRVPIQ